MEKTKHTPGPAAPDLLEAAKILISSLVWERKRSGITYAGSEKLEAAIAKAEGESDIFKYGVGDAEKSQMPKAMEPSKEKMLKWLDDIEDSKTAFYADNWAKDQGITGKEMLIDMGDKEILDTIHKLIKEKGE